MTEHIVNDADIHLVLICKCILNILTYFFFEFVFTVISALVEVEIIENVKLILEMVYLNISDVFYLILLDDLLAYEVFSLRYSL